MNWIIPATIVFSLLLGIFIGFTMTTDAIERACNYDHRLTINGRTFECRWIEEKPELVRISGSKAKDRPTGKPE